MHSFLVSVAPNVPESPFTLHLFPEKTLGIDDIRQIRTFLSRKPPTGAHNSVIVHAAEKLTLPAQHAILKILEEPPAGSLIYLVTAFPDELLPTILSRVEIVESAKLPNEKPASSAKTFDLINSLVASGAGERLKLVEDQNFTRDTALLFLEQLELSLHENLHLPFKYDLIFATRKYLLANVNVRLAMDNFALSL